MKVLILATFYPNAENPVLGTFVHEQAVALRAAGVDVRIVNPTPRAPFPVWLLKSAYRKFNRIPLVEEYQGFTVYHPRYITLPNHLLFEHVGGWMYSATRQTILDIHREWPFDIIHAHTTYPCGYAANLIRNNDIPNVKVVHTIHRTCIIDAPTYNADCYGRVQQSLTGADQCVFVSREGVDLAMKITEGAIAPSTRYITNGVNTQQFAMSSADSRRVTELKSQYAGTRNIVFVGNLSERKGIKELLTAVEEMTRLVPNFRLFLVGRNELGGYVTDFVNRARLADRVIQVGPVSHSDVKIWMHFADIFILPSHSEGLPTVLFEALFTGTPSIFTRVGGVADVVTDGEHALIIEPKSIPGIVIALRRLMDDRELRHRLSTNGRELVRSKYTWTLNASQHTHLYSQIVGN